MPGIPFIEKVKNGLKRFIKGKSDSKSEAAKPADDTKSPAGPAVPVIPATTTSITAGATETKPDVSAPAPEVLLATEDRKVEVMTEAAPPEPAAAAPTTEATNTEEAVSAPAAESASNGEPATTVA
ncbi:hypothetical protein ED733_006152 [Metarhizium rileyi]|uniref:Uncharacterized protein n=1 Tax=Metarhizium rileyi (strain RCEF 4871) TaxID=1649241 RepID=A0A5C6GDG6_METRR|nr:hypothetical protein ED733_006152 [Metarhizium rileyi]